VAPLHLILITAIQVARPAFQPGEVTNGLIRWATGIAIAYLVQRLIRRMPWPRPFRFRFLAVHVVAAPVAAALWHVSSSAILALVTESSFAELLSRRWDESLFMGVFLYALIAGVSHAIEASGRAARAEALAAHTQLAALRAQIHPHFLFNALHAVVQLIPIEPKRAAEAAELVADLLRTTLEEQRDEVTLGDEWRFVSRYLALERIRFGDRLVVSADIGTNLLDERVPAFALQTLVENAVHHGAAPRVAATEIAIAAAGSASELTLSVRNTGDGEAVRTTATGAGTGLARLRERLSVLHGRAASLVCRPLQEGGFEAVLVVPRNRRSEA
jgi:two-component system, LytTR family, sensor kinase